MLSSVVPLSLSMHTQVSGGHVNTLSSTLACRLRCGWREKEGRGGGGDRKLELRDIS